MEKKWYVVHTYSGFENKVKAAIEEASRDQGLTEQIGRVLVPSENITSLKKGVKKVTTRKFFPGYVLVEMELNELVLKLIKGIPKVSGFLGSQTEPSPLRKDEVAKIIEQEVSGAPSTKMKRKFSKGDAIRIIDGPFENFTGTIEDVSLEKERVKVMVSIFGRATPVEFEFLQIERIT